MSTRAMSRRGGRWVPEVIVAALLISLPFGCAAAFSSVDLLSRILLWGLFGIGFDLLFGYSGLLSFGQAAFYGTGGFVTAYLLTTHTLSSVWLAMLAGVLAASVFSLLVGYLALRRVGLYFAMITLAFAQLSFFVENSPLAPWTGGENGLPGIPPPTIHIGSLVYSFAGEWRIYELIATLFFLGYVLARFIVRSPAGAVLAGIRQNADRTAALGHSVPGYKLSVFVLAAAYAGLAGALLGIFQSYMPPGAFSIDTSGQLVFQTVIGGVGTLLGPAIGAAVWLFLRAELQQIPGIGSLWMFILGAIFVLLVTLLRKGLYGSVVAWWQSRRAVAVAPAFVRPRPSAVPATPRVVADASVPSVLEACAVSKHFGGIRAVSDVSLAVPAGEIYAVIGPNGAGKTTFLRMLSGEMVPSAGRILLRGQDITGRSVTAVNQAGIAKSYQVNQLFNDLTGRQNLRIAALARHRGPLRFDVFRAAESIPAVEQSIAGLIEELGLAASADLPVATLAYGEKRRIELGLALATQPSVLLLDEPLAGLSPGERQDVIRLIRRLAEGRTIVLVEHDMDAVFALAARIMVMHEGRPLAEGTPSEIRCDAQVRRAYLGGMAAHVHA
ncbi:MAG TPA: branched-chain amino acid ABC transporter ATP-binding protein/permease [Rhodopila sp.]|jgi:branched-chain amino acid transport system permease protein|nr:branched-chain amino acid ABC transporter ATP-binding protein/permease [Rhodopila sp.]